jgi:hypothetical protein
VPVNLIIASEKTKVMGEEMLMKTYLGNLVVNDLSDNVLAVPNVRWVKEDFRLVVRVKGGFDNMVDGSGNHGDCFDGVKLAIDAVGSNSGPAEADAAPVGGANADYRRPDFNRPDHSTDLDGKDQFLAI